MKFRYTDRNTVKGIPETEKPIWENYETPLGSIDVSGFERDTEKYNQHIASLPEYPLQGEKPEWWPEELELDKHFVLTYQFLDSKDEWVTLTYFESVWEELTDDAKRIVAITLPEPKKQESEDWRRRLFKHMDEQHNLILLDSELDEIKEILLPTKYPYTL